jgi:hypothetical protein
MPSDAQVPPPAPQQLTVPAYALVVVLLAGMAWGIGLFLLGRQVGRQGVEPAADQGASHLGWLNRVDQLLARGDLVEARELLATASLPHGPLGATALEMRRARMAAMEAERAAIAVAASPPAVLRRLRASLRPLEIAGLAWSDPAIPDVAPPSDAPEPAIAPRAPVVPPIAEVPRPALPAETLAGESFIPLARIAHPSIAQRAYALHPTRGLLRSDDGGTTWRPGLAPLTTLGGTALGFSGGEDPLLVVLGPTVWLFADGEPGFFP